jgi:hypothetical protein
MFWTLLLQSLPAFPCAALTVRQGEFASSDAQEVILRRTEDGSEVSYRVTYDGDASEFGWVIVVPGTVSEVAEGNEADFELLREATDPVVTVYGSPDIDGGGGCGCEPTMKGGGDGLERNFADTGGVDILSEGFSGPYEYTVLAAEDDSELIDWLESHDFELGGSQTTLAEYVAEGGYSFVAVTLSPDEALTAEAGTTLPPLDIQTDSTELRFPARMALTGAPEWVRTTVWVVGASTASIVDGWTSKNLTWLNSDDQEPSEYYAEHLQGLASADPVYARIFTGKVDGSWVTRFDTYAARAVHTADPIFEYETDQTTHRLEIISEDTGAAWLLLPFLGLGWGLRRRYQSDST